VKALADLLLATALDGDDDEERDDCVLPMFVPTNDGCVEYLRRSR
jgi:hypothetical protein